MTLARRSVRAETGCLLWIGSRDKRTGYGVIGIAGKPVKVHRAAWEVAHGPIPPALKVCHTCDVRNCIEPSHLWLGTQAQNILDARAKGRLVLTGARLGHRHSPETRAKLSERARLRPHLKHTAEAKAKMAEKQRAAWQRGRQSLTSTAQK